MHFTILDPNVSTTMNGFLIVANIINLIYNIPQIITTYKRKSTRDFSGVFLLMRFVGNNIWIAYAIEVDSLLMLINNIVTVVSSAFVGYYKVIELYNDYKKKKYKPLSINDEIIEGPIQVISVQHNTILNNEYSKKDESTSTYLVEDYMVNIDLEDDKDKDNLL